MRCFPTYCLGGLLTCWLLFVAGCGGDEPAPAKGNTPQQQDDTSAAGGHSETDPPPVDLTQTSFMGVDLVAAFEEAPEAVLEALGGKVIEVSGEVFDVGHETDQESAAGELIRLGEPFVILSSGLKCLTKDEKPWSTCWEYDLVLVKGRLATDGLVLHDCEVSLAIAGEESITRMSTANLAAEFGLDPEAATEAYLRWPIEVTGDVELVYFNDPPSVLLTGQDGIRIGCVLTAFEYHRIAGLEPGDQFTAVGEFARYDAEQKVVELQFCLPVRIAK